MRRYEELPGLENLYLEESWVEDLVCSPGEVAFTMNLVLTESHPDFRAPSVDKQYCYRHGRIVIAGVSSVTWNGQGTSPARDASGTVDFGNIDVFKWEPGRYFLDGDWGHMEVVADGISVNLDA